MLEAGLSPGGTFLEAGPSERTSPAIFEDVAKGLLNY